MDPPYNFVLEPTVLDKYAFDPERNNRLVFAEELVLVSLVKTTVPTGE